MHLKNNDPRRFEFEFNNLFMEIYETVKSIGSGSFGQVYLSRNKREDK